MVTPIRPPFFTRADVPRRLPRDIEKVKAFIKARRPKKEPLPFPLPEDVEAQEFFEQILSPEQVKEQFGIDIDPEFKGRSVEGELRLISPLGEDLDPDDVIQLPGGRWVSQFQAQRELGVSIPGFVEGERQRADIGAPTAPSLKSPEAILQEAIQLRKQFQDIGLQAAAQQILSPEQVRTDSEALVDSLEQAESRAEAIEILQNTFPEITMEQINEIMPPRLTPLMGTPAPRPGQPVSGPRPIDLEFLDFLLDQTPELQEQYIESLQVLPASPQLVTQYPEGIPLTKPEWLISDEDYLELTKSPEWWDYRKQNPEDIRAQLGEFTWDDAIRKARAEEEASVLHKREVQWWESLLFFELPFFAVAGTAGALSRTLGNIAKKFGLKSVEGIAAKTGQAVLAPLVAVETAVDVTLRYGVGIPLKYFAVDLPSQALKTAFEKVLDTGLDKWLAIQGSRGSHANGVVAYFLKKNKAWLYKRAQANIIKNRGKGSAVDIAKAAAEDTIADAEIRLLAAVREASTTLATKDLGGEASTALTKLTDAVQKGTIRPTEIPFERLFPEGVIPKEPRGLMSELVRQGVSPDDVLKMTNEERVTAFVEPFAEKAVAPVEPEGAAEAILPPDIMEQLSIPEVAKRATRQIEDKMQALVNRGFELEATKRDFADKLVKQGVEERLARSMVNIASENIKSPTVPTAEPAAPTAVTEPVVPRPEPGEPEAGIQRGFERDVEVRPRGRGVERQASLEAFGEVEARKAATREAEIEKLLATPGRLPKGEGTRGELQLEQARLEAEKEIAGVVRESGKSVEEAIKGIDSLIREVGTELGNRSLPFHGRAKNLFPGRTTKQLDLMIETFEKFRAGIEPPVEPEVKAISIPPSVEGIAPVDPFLPTTLTPEQIGLTLNLFKGVLQSPAGAEQRAMTLELRKHVLARRAARLRDRTEELIIEGKPAEEAINQATQETMSGQLPQVTSQFLDEVTEEMRDVLFARVYQVLSQEPFELMSTVDALSNALQGRSIPRIPGIKGGSAYSRLQRVFGDQPEILKALDKEMPLRDVVDAVLVDVPPTPVPVDAELAEYLRNLATIPHGQARLGEEFREFERLKDLRTRAEKELAAAESKLGIQKLRGDITQGEYEIKLSVEREKVHPTIVQLDKQIAEYLRGLSIVPTGKSSLDIGVEILTREYLKAGYGEPWEFTRLEDLRTLAERELAITEARLDKLFLDGVIDKGTLEIEKSVAREKVHPMIIPPTMPPGWPPSDVVLGTPSMIPPKQRLLIVRALLETGSSVLDMGNFMRANMASFDFSWWRQQAPLIAGNLGAFMTGNVKSWNAIWSQKAADASWEAITRDPLYQLYDEAGYDFLRPLTLPKGTARWKGVEEFGFLQSDRPIPRFTEKIPWVRVSQRLFVTGANEMNWKIFKQYYEAMLKVNERIATGQVKLKAGEAFSVTNEMKDFARLLSDFTGRAVVGEALGKLTPAANSLFFSLRLNMGRILTPRHLISSNPRIRKAAWKNLLLFIGSIGGFIAAGEQLGLWDVEWDPRSANFAKIRIGNIRVEPWGGFQQFVVFFSRVIKRSGLVSSTGMEYQVDPLQAFFKFTQSKFSPLATTFKEFVTGKDFLGDKVDWADPGQYIEKVTPFAARDMWEAFVEQGPSGALIGLPAIVGANVQTYSGDWRENWKKLGLPKYDDNVAYSIRDPKYTTEDFWADTASEFTGVDPETLTAQKGFPPHIRAIVEAKQILEEISIIPNVRLTSINADLMKGDTFVQYYQQWQERLQITDEEELKAFDADERTRNAELGNMTQTQLALLTEYHSLPESEQKAFLEEHPEIGEVPRNEWLKSHPKENAQLAVWGKAKLLTQAAYDEFQRLIKELDIPSNAIEKTTLPPPAAIESYFKYNDAVAEFAANSAEALVITAENEALQKWGAEVFGWQEIDTPLESLRISVQWREQYEGFAAIDPDDDEEQRKYKVDNWNWAKADWKRDAYNKGFEDVDGYVARAEIVFNTSPGSIETREFMLEHPDLIQEGLDLEVWTEDFKDDSLPALKLRIRHKDKFAAYDAIDSEDTEARDAYLEKNTQFRDDRRRIDMFEWEATDETLIENHVEYSQLEGIEASLYRFDNPDYDAFRQDTEVHGDNALRPLDESRIPIWRIDVEFREQDEEYDALQFDDPVEQREARDDYLEDNEDYRVARREREAYEYGVTDTALVEAYVAYYELPVKGFRQERFLKDNPGFYNKVYRDKDRMDNAAVDFTKIPDARYDDLSEKWSEELEEWDAISIKHKGVADSTDRAKLIEQDRKKLLAANPGLFGDMLRIEAYAMFFPQASIEKYVEYYSILEKERPEGWRSWEDERYLAEHRGFYETAKDILEWTRVIDWDKIATKTFETLYNETYTQLRKPNGSADSDARQALRWETRDENEVKWFDKEGLRLGIFSSPVRPLPTSVIQRLEEQGLLEEFRKRFK